MKILENDKEKLKIEIEDLTFINVLNETIWAQKGVEFSAYSVEHPYMSKPVLLVNGKNPEKTIKDAANQIKENVQDLKKKWDKLNK